MAELRQGKRRSSLLEQMPPGGVCAEIGVWEGDFSARILETTHPRLLHLVDPWRYEAGEAYEGAWYAGGRARNQADMDAVYAGIVQRFAEEVESGRVDILRLASAEAAVGFGDESLDWVYIDGNHLYEYVKQDLEMWSRKVRPGGFITGDDYGDGGWWKGGVKKAVDEFCSVSGRRLTLIRRQFIIDVT